VIRPISDWPHPYLSGFPLSIPLASPQSSIFLDRTAASPKQAILLGRRSFWNCGVVKNESWMPMAIDLHGVLGYSILAKDCPWAWLASRILKGSL
jgi:hypothetical protein